MNHHPLAARATVLVGATALVLLLAGCATAVGSGGGGNSPSPTPTATVAPTPGARDITGKWYLVSGTDAKGAISPGGTDVTFTFNGASSGGHSTCNSFGANAIGTTAGPVTIVIGIHTEIACVDPELMTTEDRYFAALGKVDTASVIDGTLTLSGAGDTLVFQRTAP
ncbi:MAG TPA: META domain-containing protein [Galbitalea sp.]